MRSTKPMTMLLSIFLIAITQTLASPASIPGYKVVEARWGVETSPNGPLIQLNGTIQEVEAQLSRDYPTIKQNFLPNASVDKRDIVPNPKWGPTLCGNRGLGWYAADRSRVLQGIDHLRHHCGLYPGVDAGPRTCTRVSCSYSAAIYWCNDESHELKLHDCGALADAAQLLADQCQIVSSVGSSVMGQIFTLGADIGRSGYNVAIHDANC